MANFAGKEESTKPLTYPSPAVHPADVEMGAPTAASGGGSGSSQFLRKHRCAVICCGCCAATVVLLGVAVLVLALTVFKVQDPTVTVNNVTLRNINPGIGSLTSGSLITLNVTLIADISIKNPNVASFKYDANEVKYYRAAAGSNNASELVAVAYVPSGNAEAYRTTELNATVDVMADKLIPSIDVGDLLGSAQQVSLTSSQEVKGEVDVLGIYKRKMKIDVRCNITLSVSINNVDSTQTDCSTNVE